MSATTVTSTTSLKRKRDWSGVSEDDDDASPARLIPTTVGAGARSTPHSASKRPRCIVDLTSPLAGNDDDDSNDNYEAPNRKPLAPISSCRYESPRLPPPCMEDSQHQSPQLDEQPMTEVEPSTTSSHDDIEITPSTEPIAPESSSQKSLPFGFDTTLSNIRFGLLKSKVCFIIFAIY